MLRTLLALSLLATPILAETSLTKASLTKISAADISLADSPFAVIPRTPAEAARIVAVVAPTTDFSKPEPFEAKPAGATTVRVRPGPDVFSQYSANMPFDRQMNFNLGNALFTKTWVAAPASTLASDGLGPLFNAGGCQDCHLKDGRGHVPAKGEVPVSLFLRLSVPGGTVPHDIADWIATIPEPTYGAQLQTFSTAAVPAEGAMTTTYTERPVQMNGETASLRVPAYAITDPAYGSPRADLMLSPRLAPQMIGLGLLEAIPSADILAREDPDDTDKDGISGRASLVPSGQAGQPLLGRFGLKAGAATVMDQSAAAFAGDMGLSTALHPDPAGDCTASQTACQTAPNGQQLGLRDGLEVDRASLDLVTFYARNLAVPERRDIDGPTVLHGKQVFYDLGCTGCHTPKFVTNRLTDQPEQSFQLIWPYTDLLLHDMGDGLADNRPEGRATGREWKTPPLWGIGLTAQTTGHTNFLHDGRARTLLEAILWHGGEAQSQRDAVVALPKPNRAALIAYLESL
ncbi:MAG: thiol oxidoreductase [Candidatus Saccharibacteria bacterium]|nr:thiol oxidoreductase [Pseudorhodobacter sp.]